MSLEALRLIIAEKVSEFRLFERSMSEFTESLNLSAIYALEILNKWESRRE